MFNDFLLSDSSIKNKNEAKSIIFNFIQNQKEEAIRYAKLNISFN